MHYRLLLNILSTDNKIITDNKELKQFINLKSEQVKIKMLKAVVNYFKPDEIDIYKITSLLYENPLTGKEGEEYLGYKKGNKNKEKYLENWVKKYINIV